jgi:hypothetical protein
MISLYQALGPHRSWRVAGPVLLAAALASGCSAAGSSSTPSSGSSSRPGSSASFRQCMQSHGVTVPSQRPTPGSGQPRTRPTGANSSAFRKAIQACGGSSGGGFGGGGNGPAG